MAGGITVIVFEPRALRLVTVWPYEQPARAWWGSAQVACRPARGTDREHHGTRGMEGHHPLGPQRVHLLGRGCEAGDHAGASHPPDPGGARRRPASALLLAWMQAPGTHTAACLSSRSAASAGRRHHAAERIVGSALEPYKVEPDRQAFLFDVDETWVARYEYELQDGAPVFTGVRVFAGSARDVGYGPDEAGPPSPGGLTATALAKVTPGAHLSALYRELRERAEEAERERARGPRLSELAGKPPFS